MIPLDSSVSSTLAQAKTNIKLPGRLEKVTLASFGNGNVDGDWHYAGGEISINADQVAEISMDLVRDSEPPATSAIPPTLTPKRGSG